MDFVATADTHLGYTYGRSSKTRKVIADFIFNQFERIVDHTIKSDSDLFIHAGDVFNRSKPPKWAQKRFYSQIERLVHNEIFVLLIPGNHDRAKLTNSLLEYYSDYLHIFNHLKKIKINNISMIGFPFDYSNPKKSFEKAQHLIDPHKSSLIICHQLFRGAEFGPHRFKFWDQDDVISMETSPANLQVITGHIHRAQVLNGGKVVYTGSPLRTSFAESIEPKGFITGQIGPSHIFYRFRPLRGFPMEVIEIHIDDLWYRLDDLTISREKRTLLRLIGSNVSANLLSEIERIYPTNDYPLLSISPRSPTHRLKALYGNYKDTFKEFSVSRYY